MQEPASPLVPESAEPPLPLPLPASLVPPLPLPLLLPPPPLLLLVPPSLAPPELPVPHLPAVHESEQQLPYAEHELPSGSHLVVPQTPFMQSLLQQSVLPVHVWPSGLHEGAGGLHVPESQELLQHSLFLVQAVPSAEQEDDWQVPDTQSLLQQSALALHVPPMPAHMGWAHVPLVHAPLQQSLAPWQALPEDMHVGAAQTPAVQVALQQSLESAHAWPALRQTSSAQRPAEQDMLQQSLYALHEAPPARHLPAGTGLLEPLPLAPSPDVWPSSVDPPPASAPKPAPLLGLDAQPWPVRATSGNTSSTVTSAQARPSERRSGIGSPLAGSGKCIDQARHAPPGSNVGTHSDQAVARTTELRPVVRWIAGDPTSKPPAKVREQAGRPQRRLARRTTRVTTDGQWSNGGSNPGPLHCERSALPAELLPR